MLGVQLQNQEDLHQQVYRLADASEKVSLGQQIDLEALAKMPLSEPNTGSGIRARSTKTVPICRKSGRGAAPEAAGDRSD